MSVLTLQVSIGEALDKLSILHIKKQFITDTNKLKDVEYEYDIIYKEVKVLLDKPEIKYQYDCLVRINTEIWKLCDDIRKEEDKETKSTSDKEYAMLCIKIIQVNDQRFRIKNKINMYSLLKERKSYPSKKAIILNHLGMGDMFTMNGANRYLSTLYDELVIISRKEYLEATTQMYSDDPTIKVVSSDKNMPSNEFLQEYENKGYKVLKTGIHVEPPNEYFYLQFYKHLNLEYDIKTTWCYIHRDKEREEKLVKSLISRIKEPLPIIFVHCDGLKLSQSELSRDILYYNVNKNIYPEGHKFHEIWDGVLSNNILDYSLLMEYASGIMIFDSSFFCLALNLNLNASNKIVMQRSKDYDLNSYFPDKNSDWKLF